VKRLLHRAISPLAARLAPTRWKRLAELHYWKDRKRAERVLANDHYERFCTAHFGLDRSFYEGKVVLDVGCGPRGSLEWASMAALRIGLDPLADRYLRLGTDRHRMEYLCAPAEEIPLDDASCDVALSFNSLDHVEDVARAVAEIKRVTRPGGTFLLLVEVNHPPTACEPHTLSPRELVGMLEPAFSCEEVEVYRPVEEGMYESIQAGEKAPDPLDTRVRGYLSARFTRA
jgi:ubiquinone/menaquinone biosynthesis C-methylase UbiE